MADEDDTPFLFTPFGFLVALALVLLIAFGYYYLLYRGGKAIYNDYKERNTGKKGRSARPAKSRKSPKKSP